MIVPRLRLDQEPIARQSMTNLNDWAKEGLRTLVFAYRDLSTEDFTQWQALLEKARLADEDRAKKVAAVFAMLEQDLVLQGASAIEDKLQDHVPETIELLRGAGIKFWMLTGDKFSTAKEIANSCRLKSRDERARVEKIQGVDAEEVGMCIRDIHEKYLREQVLIEGHEHQQTKGYELTVAIEGPTLDLAMAYHQPALTALLLGAHSVIGCRVLPIQKANLVKMVKDCGKMTLAIGDGGNDVGMIQQAHIGVGIRGQEGRQAARAADYTISLFHHLRYLLLVHGRYAYTRSALVAQYSFYKSFFFCIIQIGYGFTTLFSGILSIPHIRITFLHASTHEALLLVIMIQVVHCSIPYV
jgi:phospholipid-translocating ATPase